MRNREGALKTACRELAGFLESTEVSARRRTAENRFIVKTNRKSVLLTETWNEDFDEGK